MKIKTKQNITGIVLPILSLPPVYFAFLHNESEADWLLIFLSLLPCLIMMGIFRLLWGPDCFGKSAWQKQGYKNFKEWFINSESFNAKLLRFNFKVFIPVFFGLSILFAIVIIVLKQVI